MKIDSSAIGMESVRTYRTSRTTTLRFGMVRNPQEAEKQETGTKTGEHLSRDSFSLGEWENRFGVTKTRLVRVADKRSSIEDDIHQSAIRYIFALLFGNRQERLMQRYTPVSLEPLSKKREEECYLEIREEEWEDISFQTRGMVKTADGREICFDLGVSMSQSFQRVYADRVAAEKNVAAAVAMCDPLVINLNGNIAECSDLHFYFDLDCDGETEKLSGLSQGSGFLALDKNNDGCISDGNELFGAKNGDGFADLSAYDKDRNGWIDENDDIWSKLKIWCVDGQGEPKLYGLTERNVGAICLANLGTDINLRGENGQLQGAIRKTGVFLYENGTVGTIQHLDLVKNNT